MRFVAQRTARLDPRYAGLALEFTDELEAQRAVVRAGILAALAIAYTLMNLLAIRKTSTGQTEVERYRYEVSSRVGDVIGNVTVVQSFNRLQAEAQAMRDLPILPLYHENAAQLYQPWVRGMHLNAIEFLDLSGVWFERH